MNMAQAFRLILILENIDQQKLAKKLEVSTATISLIVRGKRGPSMKLCQKIANFAGITVSQLHRLNELTIEDLTQW